MNFLYSVISFVLLIILMSSQATIIQAQTFVDTNTYHFYENKKAWYLDEEVYNQKRLHNYQGCAEVIDSLIKLDSACLIHGYAFSGALCHDRLGNWDRVLEILTMLKMNDREVMCLNPRNQGRTFNRELLNSLKFKRLCPDYPRMFDQSEVQDQVLLDSLVLLMVWSHGASNRQAWVRDMGYAHYYNIIPDLPLKELKRMSSEKIDKLISRRGFPTKEKIGKSMVNVLVYLDIIHSPDLETLLKYQNIVKDNVIPRRYALLLDKISVQREVPQLYGTQIIPGTDGDPDKFYPISNMREVNDRRMKVGLPPLESYANIHSVSLDGMEFDVGYN